MKFTLLSKNTSLITFSLCHCKSKITKSTLLCMNVDNQVTFLFITIRSFKRKFFSSLCYSFVETATQENIEI